MLKDPSVEQNMWLIILLKYLFKNLNVANLIDRCPPDSLPIVKYLIRQCKKVSKVKEEKNQKVGKTRLG